MTTEERLETWEKSIACARRWNRIFRLTVGLVLVMESVALVWVVVHIDATPLDIRARSFTVVDKNDTALATLSKSSTGLAGLALNEDNGNSCLHLNAYYGHARTLYGEKGFAGYRGRRQVQRGETSHCATVFARGENLLLDGWPGYDTLLNTAGWGESAQLRPSDYERSSPYGAEGRTKEQAIKRRVYDCIRDEEKAVKMWLYDKNGDLRAVLVVIECKAKLVLLDVRGLIYAMLHVFKGERYFRVADPNGKGRRFLGICSEGEPLTGLTLRDNYGRRIWSAP